MFKDFVSLYKPYKKLFFLDIFSALMMTGIDMLFPLSVSYLVDNVIPARNMRILCILCIAVLLGYIAKYFFEKVVIYYGHVLGVSLENSLRKRVFEQYEKFSFSYFDENRTGNIISRLTTDAFDISEFAHHGPEDFFISVFILIGSFVILMKTDAVLTLVIFAIIPVMIFFALSSNSKWEGAMMDVRKANAELTSTINDSFSGVRVVKAFTNEKLQYARFSYDCDNYSKFKRLSYKFMAEFTCNVNFFIGFLKLVTIFLGGYFVYKERITIGALMQFMLYIDLFIQPVNRFTNMVEDFQKTKTGFKRCMEILKTEPEIIDAPNCVDAGKLNGDIEFKHVSFSYGDGDILKDFNLSLKAGESVAVVGSSGAGKTTMCSLIPRFYDVTEGEVSVDGVDVRKYSQSSLRNNIGIVQQDVFLFSGTIRENILYGNAEASEEEVRRAAEFANLDSFVETLPDKYDTIVGERGVKLSGGQKQRISIARIFLKNPPILLLDEATSSLDNENEKKIQQSFDKLSEHRTTIIIAHRLQTIQNAKRIIVMDKGKIVEQGDHETLLAQNGLYAKLYSAQSGIIE